MLTTLADPGVLLVIVSAALVTQSIATAHLQARLQSAQTTASAALDLADRHARLLSHALDQRDAAWSALDRADREAGRLVSVRRGVAS